MFDSIELVDDDPDRDAADLLGAGPDRVEAEAIGIGARDQQHDLASALVVAGAPGVGQVGAKVDQVLAHGLDGLGVGRPGAGAEYDRHAGSGATGDRRVAGQQHDDLIAGRMFDRNAGEAPGKFAGDGVGRGDARLLRLQPPQRLAGRNAVPRGILLCVVGQGLHLRLDRLRERRLS